MKIIVISTISTKQTQRVSNKLKSLGFIINELFPANSKTEDVSEEAARSDTSAVIICADKADLVIKAKNLQKDIIQGYGLPIPVIAINLQPISFLSDENIYILEEHLINDLENIIRTTTAKIEEKMR